MASRILYAIGFSLAVLSLTAAAQSTPPPAVSGTTTASGTAAPDGAARPGARAAHAKHRHHARMRHHQARAAAHHRMRHHARAGARHEMRHHARAEARHAHHAGMRADSGQYESGYQGALKRCVAGAPDQRDRCLDDAIARYRRS
jgi:hypothetical protein